MDLDLLGHVWLSYTESSTMYFLFSVIQVKRLVKELHDMKAVEKYSLLQLLELITQLQSCEGVTYTFSLRLYIFPHLLSQHEDVTFNHNRELILSFRGTAFFHL